MSSPANRTRPVHGLKPAIASNSVVLPAPLGPMSPTTSPSSTANDTDSTAVSPP